MNPDLAPQTKYPERSDRVEHRQGPGVPAGENQTLIWGKIKVKNSPSLFTTEYADKVPEFLREYRRGGLFCGRPEGHKQAS